MKTTEKPKKENERLPGFYVAVLVFVVGKEARRFSLKLITVASCFGSFSDERSKIVIKKLTI